MNIGVPYEPILLFINIVLEGTESLLKKRVLCSTLQIGWSNLQKAVGCCFVYTCLTDSSKSPFDVRNPCTRIQYSVPTLVSHVVRLHRSGEL